MKRLSSWNLFKGTACLVAFAMASGCDANTVLAPDDAPSIVLGRVAAVGAAAPAATPALTPGSSLAGIEVRAEGVTVSAITDESGAFRVEARSGDGRIRLRFRRGSMDVRLELSGMPPGGVIRLEVNLSDSGVTVLSTDEGRGAEFEGVVQVVSVRGDAPARTARLTLADEGAMRWVDIIEGSTTFDNSGDILSFDRLLTVVDNGGNSVEVEGEGVVQDDGSIVATEVKAELEDADDDDNDDNDDGPDSPDVAEFEGAAALVGVDGDAPTRTARVSLTSLDGVSLVDIVEGSTTFDALGDVLSFEAMMSALGQGGLSVKIEGDGERQADGSVVATSVKVETDDGS